MSISDRICLGGAPFEAAFRMLPRPALVVDRTGTVIAANIEMREKFFRMAGAEPGLGDRLDTLFEGDAARLRSDMFAAASGSRLTVHSRPRGEAPGGRIAFLVRALRQGERAECFLLTEATIRPISKAFRELNAALRDANEAAARARRLHRQLQENYRHLETFSYVAAHDLKAPLRNIAALLGIVDEDYGAELPAGAKELLEAARHAADRLQGLISALLSHARSNSVELSCESVEIAGVVDDVLRDLSAMIAEAGAEIRVAGDVGAATADPPLLHQLLENLVGNAIKYSHAARPPVVTIERRCGAAVPDRLVVSDNGIGFDNALKDKLFEPFHRLHTDAAVEGSGVGLATCRTICERHGWTLDAEGRPGTGARFEISGIYGG